MISLLKKTSQIYFKNFRFFFKAISLLLIPFLILRIIAHYTYLGRLTTIFSTLFGLILLVMALLVEIIIIAGSYQLIAASTAGETLPRISLKSKWKQTRSKFFPYLYLKIITGLQILSLPFLLKTIVRLSPAQGLIYLATILSTTWIIAFTFLLLFAGYSLIIENQTGIAALQRSFNLSLQHPYKTIGHLLVGSLSIGIIFTLLALFTNISIALLTGQTFILLNRYLSPWWQNLVIEAYALFSLPLLIIIINILFYNLKKKENNKD